MSGGGKTPFFTIIVPACEVGPYAGEMVRSVKNQTDPDFECIIVVETSVDGTLQTIRDACGDDPRFIVSEQKRSGSASQPRNYGMKHARGEYVVFLDGDDWLEPDALAVLRQTAAGGAELLLTDGHTWAENSDGSRECRMENRQLAATEHPATGAEFLIAAILGYRLRVAVWFFCFRRSLLERCALEQPPGRLHQDNAWTWRICLEAESFAATRRITYNYRKRQNSVTWKLKPKSVRDMELNVIEILQVWRRLKACGAPRIKLTATAYYLSCVFSIIFLGFRAFSQLPPEDCAAGLRRILPDADAVNTVRDMLGYIKPSRRAELLLLLFARRRGCFAPTRWFTRYVYLPLRRFYASRF